MRSFQLFRYSPPEKTAADYTEVEKEQFREQFKPIARRYRMCSRIFLVGIFCCFALLLFFATKSAALYSWIILVFIGLVALFVSVSIFWPPLCSACKRRVDGEARTFCPVCGGKVERSGFLKIPYCPSCDTVLRRGRIRIYDVRCCTHCGVFLDGKGI
jgi:hypothetical protein